MWCPKCEKLYPFLSTKAQCIVCATPLNLTADDFLDNTPIQIVEETRPPQVELAVEIEEAVRRGHHLVAEAGTGVGKSFALLLPPILAKKKVVISTATIALQHQYMTKDLPYLASALVAHGIEFNFAVAKGKGNYLCERLLAKEQKGKGGFTEKFLERVETSEFGDKIDFDGLIPWYLWSNITAEDCTGSSGCVFAQECGFLAARALVVGAQVIVANHSIVGFNLRFGKKLLPEHELLILDEAHQAASYLRNAFADTLTEKSFRNLLDRLEKMDVLPDILDLDEIQDRILGANKALFGCLPASSKFGTAPLEVTTISSKLGNLELAIRELLKPMVKLLAKTGTSGDLRQVYLDPAMKLYMTQRWSEREERAEGLVDVGDLIIGIRKLENLRAVVEGIRDADERSTVFLEFPRTKRGSRKIMRSPIFINHILSTLLYPATKVTASSATLTLARRFDSFREKMGFPKDPKETKEFLTASPFDYEHRSILYLSKRPEKGGIPAPPSPSASPEYKEEYYAALSKEIWRLCEISGGCAFVLFTSRRDMEEVFKRVAKVDPMSPKAAEHRMMGSGFSARRQEEGSSAASLERWFRKTKQPVLFGLKSFWEGISIEGQQLRLIIIAKLPFPVPSDPVHQAQEKHLKAQGLGGYQIFQRLSIPEMVADVQQGTGRLIRTMKDYGVCAILDSRAVTKAYSQVLINSLPYTVITDKRQNVRAFFAGFKEKP